MTASQFYADTDAPVTPLQAKYHFEKLTDKEKLYAHHVSRAAHFGTRVVARSVSPESESIYDLILSLHAAVKGVYDQSTFPNVSEHDLKYYLEYASQFLSNLGNYKSFGDVKFVPRLDPDNFKSIVAKDPEAARLYSEVAAAIYSVEPSAENFLGYPEKGHISAYYTPNITKAEIEAIQTALADKGVLPENTRLFKKNGKFQLMIASANTAADSKADKTLPVDPIDLPNNLGKLEFVYGDHHKEFAAITAELEQALKYVANETQHKMMESYIASFKTGSMEAHKQSQRYWVKDIGPRVEQNLGFIETYRDPSGVRGEWEGLVAMVDIEGTAKFAKLVSSAQGYIKDLPWPQEFEKDVFTPPDFTSLEVLTFAGSGIPAGINIPNYDDVRANIGFKNVSLGNVVSAKSANEKTTFLTEEDAAIHDKLRGAAWSLQVGIHEMGHGFGKLLSENPDGTFNFDKANPPVSPITNKPVTTYYKKGETWGSVFGSLAGSYEECRAEAIAMYLATDKSIQAIFGHGETGEDSADNVLFVAYLMMARAGLLALEFWDPVSKKWGQAHMQARFSMLKCFLRAGEGFVTLKSSKPDYSDLIISLDRTKINTVGKKAVGEYLQKLHIFKTSADYANGSALYNEMTEVGPDMAKYRDIVVKSKLPRKQFVQANTELEGDKVVVKEYDSTPIGMIQSFYERRV